jgi:hypothetical protein
MKLSLSDIGYLAAMLDGEGSLIMWTNKRLTPRLVIQVVCSTNLAIVEKVRSILQKAGWRHGITLCNANPVTNAKAAWVVQVRWCDDQKEFIRAVSPEVVGKAEQLRVASAYLERRSSKTKVKPNADDAFLVAYMRKLNARGLSADSVTTARDASFLKSLRIQSELHGDMQSEAEMTSPSLTAE